MRTKRAAFTMVELLVVLAIIALLGALLAYVMPTFRERNRAAKGGQAVQGWLTYARQQAIYRQTPQGVRFMFAPATITGGSTLAVVECQYLEKPDDYDGAGHPLVTDPSDPNPPNPTRLKAAGFNFNDGSVETGDNLEIFGSGLIHSVTVVPSDPTNSPNILDMLVLSSGLPNAINTTLVNYRIIRKARVSGDESMKMPNGVIINLNLTFTSPPPGYYVPSTFQFTDKPLNTQGFFDVMFAPSGAVLDTGGSKLALWVHTQEAANAFDSNPTLIVVYTGSGAVAAYDPVPPPANPYALVR
jgi:prepilin-type N-terminal cleavage/methylation domain-containing protein